MTNAPDETEPGTSPEEVPYAPNNPGTPSEGETKDSGAAATIDAYEDDPDIDSYPA